MDTYHALKVGVRWNCPSWRPSQPYFVMAFFNIYYYKDVFTSRENCITTDRVNPFGKRHGVCSEEMTLCKVSLTCVFLTNFPHGDQKMQDKEIILWCRCACFIIWFWRLAIKIYKIGPNKINIHRANEIMKIHHNTDHSPRDMVGDMLICAPSLKYNSTLLMRWHKKDSTI
jgi:hypothetical protein